MPEVYMRVMLLSHTPAPEENIAVAGRLCYSDSHVDELREAVEGKADGFVAKLRGLGHLSVLEHSSFTFGIEGVSRALLAQITRHRLASFSVQSQRYVTSKDMTYIVPPSVKALGDEAQSRYAEQMERAYSDYRAWLDAGVKPEDARFLLPNACETRMVLTMNARELLHFFNLRCCSRAQWEIRRLAWHMLCEVRRVSPAIFAQAGSPCIAGACTEGNMSCKGAGDMRAMSVRLDKLIAQGADDDEISAFIDDAIR